MDDELIYEERNSHKRRRLASFFDRIARRLRRGEAVPIDEDQNVTVEIPDEPELQVELERENGTVSLELELDWEEASGAVETDVVASNARFEVYEDGGDQYRWRLVHRNGNIIADGSQGYSSKRKAKQGLESVRTNASGAYIVDQSDAEDAPEEGGSDALFTLYEDEGAQWRWRLVHRNGNIIADGSQGYSSKQSAKQGWRAFRRTRPAHPSSNRSSTATNPVRWAEPPTAGVASDENDDRPAGHGHGVVFRLVVDALPDCRHRWSFRPERAGATFPFVLGPRPFRSLRTSDR